MPSVEERLAYLEGRVQEHGATLGQTSEAITGVRTEIATLGAGLRGDMHAMGSELRGEMHALRSELRGEMNALRSELRGDMNAMRSELREEIAGVRKEMITGFRWLVGLQALVVVAVVTALATSFFQ